MENTCNIDFYNQFKINFKLKIERNEKLEQLFYFRFNEIITKAKHLIFLINL